MPILDICNRETGYERGGRLREPWKQKTAAWKQMSATLEDILAVARARRLESDRNGEGGGGIEVAESDAGSDEPWYDRIETGEVRVTEGGEPRLMPPEHSLTVH